MKKPLLAITMGDPAGVGPETIVGAWRNAELHAACRAAVLGNPTVLQRAATLLEAPVRVVEVDSVDDASSDPWTVPCLPCGADDAASVAEAMVDPRGGQAAYDALVAATELALAGRIDGIVTAPLHKAALWAAGHHYPGHTELLAELCHAKEVAMMLYLPPDARIGGRVGLGIVHATLHLALRDVSAKLTVESVLSKVRLADAVTRAFLGAAAATTPPRIGVCALNPHAGESGLFGDEEQSTIAPAVARAQAAGVLATGPLPADTLIARAAAGQFDAVVAMYHDQGHVAMKLLGMHKAVNITLGLPIVRTSVAHGTAFDLAWQGRAECGGMVAAVLTAAQLAQRRSHLDCPLFLPTPNREML